ncbi:MAG: neutral/alkaline non-lysosomal ceramidase N-terminal domain-containing protein [Caldiserica bacterium]|nr:neutral/alkaline non-lysosomal ceramidase N-terminal domain-containing protein [Caldisericota bacterium]
MLETGCGSAVITPRAGLQMAGFLGKRIAEGVHDDLMAKAVYLADGPENRMMLIVVDTLEVDRQFVDEVRRRVEQETGVPAACCLVAAIHTHSGPSGLERVAFWGEVEDNQVVEAFDGRLFEQTVAGCVTAAKKARRWAREGTIKSGMTSMLQPICGNRRVRTTEQVQMRVLEVETRSRCAGVYNLDCHPTVLHEENRLYSADFPGFAASIMPLFEPFVTMPVFLNGAAGDMSTRFYRQSSDFAEVKRIGTIVAESVAASLDVLEPMKGPFVVRAVEVPLRLKAKQFPSAQDLEHRIADARKKLEVARLKRVRNLRLLESAIEGLTFAATMVDKAGKVEYIDSRLSLVRFGDILVAGIPGELFSSLGNDIRAAFPDYLVLVAGYCGDYMGYIPDTAAYDEGGYEAFTTFIAKGEGERLRDAATNGLRALLA